MTTVMITGTNRGMGLELVREYAADGARVFSCCRKPQSADKLQRIAAGSIENTGKFIDYQGKEIPW